MSLEVIKQNADNLLEVSEKYEELKKLAKDNKTYQNKLNEIKNYILKLLANIEKIINQENV